MYIIRKTEQNIINKTNKTVQMIYSVYGANNMYRNDSVAIDDRLKKSNKAILVTGARQTGKT